MSDQLTGTQDALSSTIAAFNAVCAERDAAIARAEAAEALAASIAPDDAAVFVASNGASCAATRRVFDALRAHAAKVSR